MRCISDQFKKKKKYSDIFVHWDQSHLIFLNSGAHNSQRAITTRVLLFFFTEFLLVSLFSERPTNLSAKPTDLKTVLTLQ